MLSVHALPFLQAMENLPENGTMEAKAREALRFCATVGRILCLVQRCGTDASTSSECSASYRATCC